jgi:redox-sensitive bicupin YhaK (pirin superfamily)
MPEMIDVEVTTPEARRSEPRGITLRTKGHKHGFVTRLMSPGDLGELVKPFVFLDYFDSEKFSGPGFAVHPHSGIATHTTLLRGRTTYQDSTGKSGILTEHSVEWMQAGGGVWHGGKAFAGEPIRGYQLWIALPESLELAPAESHYIDSGVIEGDKRVRVLLGAYENSKSPIAYHEPLTYLHVRLNDGERWTFSPPPNHDVAWTAVHQGKLHVAGIALEGEMAVFDEGPGAIEFRAEGDTELVVGSATKHGHPLVCGSYSVHTSRAALIKGEAGIREIAKHLDRMRSV